MSYFEVMLLLVLDSYESVGVAYRFVDVVAKIDSVGFDSFVHSFLGSPIVEIDDFVVGQGYSQFGVVEEFLSHS